MYYSGSLKDECIYLYIYYRVLKTEPHKFITGSQACEVRLNLCAGMLRPFSSGDSVTSSALDEMTLKHRNSMCYLY